jgi:hypothetical protein
MREIYGDTEVEFARQDDSGSLLRLMTAVDMPVTRRKGDILQMGVDVRQHYGETVAVALY